MSDPLKRAAAAAALDYVKPGMILGLGTGSTAEEFVRLLAERVAGGLEIAGIPTSERTMELANELAVPLVDFADHPRIDLTIDGADEVDGQLRLIKGGGGALLREKIVAAASERMIVIADESKRVDALGAFPLPVEVVKFGHRSTSHAITRILESKGLDGAVTLRYQSADTPFVTDGGHLIYDIAVGEIHDPEGLAASLSVIPGVVEHGLFIGIADEALLAGPEGVTILSNEILTHAK